ncbi:MAG: methionyl-tRNA formyltransferase [Burkholderiales bacterium PBB3]|nr:MAG: methionyl-tRNA formyltransferase [Burkholderiales bacterium PBB3]
MRVIFAGTPEFARTALERLHASGHTIALVLTQPDRPAGRGMKLHPSAVKEFALQHGLPLAQPRSLRLDGKYPDDAMAARQAIGDANADVMVVAAYGLILPQWVLDLMAPLGGTKYGCLNIHGSLLPRWRGAAPIHRAIEAGDTQTGITIMQMDAGLDTGDMLLVHSVDIDPAATTASLHDQLADLGADLVVQALDYAAAGRLKPLRQPETGVSYAHKIDKSEAAIDWQQTAEVVVRRVRAFNPFPVATTSLQGELLKVWAAQVLEPEAATRLGAHSGQDVGAILAVEATGIAVAAMNSVAVLTELQRPGGKRLAVADFLRGFDVRVGMRMALHGQVGGADAGGPPV